MTTTESNFPSLILGFMRLRDYPELLSPRGLADWIGQRLDEGLDTFDHADIYGEGCCEAAFGDAIRSDPTLRQRVKVVTKADIVRADDPANESGIKHYRTDATYLRQAVDRALQRLSIDQIDTFLIHRPDPLMDAAEVVETLEEAVTAGKIRQIGVSNFLPEQWRWLASQTRLTLACNQSQLSLAHSAPLFDGTLEAHHRDHLRWLAWSPLAGGAENKGLASALAWGKEEAGLSETALKIAWLRRLPGAPVPVLGSMKAERIAEALRGCEYTMPRDLWYALLERTRGTAVA